MNNSLVSESYFSQSCFETKQRFYALKQALKAWYECVSYFLIENGFNWAKVDTSIFYYSYDLIVQIYVGDIIFDTTNEPLCEDFSILTLKEFEISMVREFKFFLDLLLK